MDTSTLLKRKKRSHTYFFSGYYFLRVVSAFLILSFLVQELSYANPDLKAAPSVFLPNVSSIQFIKFPDSVAQIEDSFFFEQGPQGAASRSLFGLETRGSRLAASPLARTRTPGTRAGSLPAGRQGPAGAMIYLLQDAHTNESAQRNIAKAIDLILEKEPVRHVFLEAGTGDDSLSFLRNYSTPQKRLEVAKSYLKKGHIQGPDYLDLTSDRPFTLWGVEDKALYFKGLECYQFLKDKRSEINAHLDKVSRTTKTLKQKIYNPSLQKLDETRERFLSAEGGKEEIPLTDYIEALSHAQLPAGPAGGQPHEPQVDSLRPTGRPRPPSPVGSSTSFYPHLHALRSLKALESSIDFVKANEEQVRAIASLPEQDQRELLGLTSRTNTPFKLDSAEHAAERGFYAVLEEKLKAKDNQLPAGDAVGEFSFRPQSEPQLRTRTKRVPKAAGPAGSYANLFEYFSYLKRANELNVKKVLEEKDSLELGLYAALAKTPDERRLVEVSKAQEILRKVLNLRATTAEYEEIVKNPQRFDMVEISGFLNKKIMDLGVHYEEALFLEKGYDEAFARAKEFYELSFRRDEKFVENMLEKLRTEEEGRVTAGGVPRGPQGIHLRAMGLPAGRTRLSSSAILVTGGFHTEHLKQILKAKNISFISITPQVLQETNQERYERILLRQPQPFFFEQGAEGAASRSQSRAESRGSRLAASPLARTRSGFVENDSISILPAAELALTVNGAQLVVLDELKKELSASPATIVKTAAARLADEERAETHSSQTLSEIFEEVIHEFKNFVAVLGGYLELDLNELGEKGVFRPDLIRPEWPRRPKEINRTTVLQWAEDSMKELKRVEGMISQICALFSEEEREAKSEFFKEDMEGYYRRMAIDARHALEPILHIGKPEEARDWDVNDLIAQVVLSQQSRGLPVYRNVKRPFTTLLTPRLPRIKVSAPRLREVLVNLIRNAAQAMPRGFKGRITISSDYDLLNHRVIIGVEDNGVGILEENLTKIWQAGFTSKPEGVAKGTGVGLGICQGIIREYGGSIEVESRPVKDFPEKHGTVFRVWLPAAGFSQNNHRLAERDLTDQRLDAIGQEILAPIFRKIPLSLEGARSLQALLDQDSEIFRWNYKTLLDRRVLPHSSSQPGFEGFVRSFERVRASGETGFLSIEFHAANQAGRGDFVTYLVDLFERVRALSNGQLKDPLFLDGVIKIFRRLEWDNDGFGTPLERNVKALAAARVLGKYLRSQSVPVVSTTPNAARLATGGTKRITLHDSGSAVKTWDERFSEISEELDMAYVAADVIAKEKSSEGLPSLAAVIEELGKIPYMDITELNANPDKWNEFKEALRSYIERRSIDYRTEETPRQQGKPMAMIRGDSTAAVVGIGNAVVWKEPELEREMPLAAPEDADDVRQQKWASEKARFEEAFKKSKENFGQEISESAQLLLDKLVSLVTAGISQENQPATYFLHKFARDLRKQAAKDPLDASGNAAVLRFIEENLLVQVDTVDNQKLLVSVFHMLLGSSFGLDMSSDETEAMEAERVLWAAAKNVILDQGILKAILAPDRPVDIKVIRAVVQAIQQKAIGLESRLKMLEKTPGIDKSMLAVIRQGVDEMKTQVKNLKRIEETPNPGHFLFERTDDAALREGKIKQIREKLNEFEKTFQKNMHILSLIHEDIQSSMSGKSEEESEEIFKAGMNQWESGMKEMKIFVEEGMTKRRADPERLIAEYLASKFLETGDYKSRNQKLLKIAMVLAYTLRDHSAEGDAAIVFIDPNDFSLVTMDDLHRIHKSYPKVAATVDEHGGISSHYTVDIKHRGGVSIVGADKGLIQRVASGDRVIVDGTAGIVYIHPDVPTRVEMYRKRDDLFYKDSFYKSRAELPVPMPANPKKLFHNLLDVSDVPELWKRAILVASSGVGLMRSENILPEPIQRSLLKGELKPYVMILEKVMKSVLAKGESGNPMENRIVVRLYDAARDKVPVILSERITDPERILKFLETHSGFSFYLADRALAATLDDGELAQRLAANGGKGDLWNFGVQQLAAMIIANGRSEDNPGKMNALVPMVDNTEHAGKVKEMMKEALKLAEEAASKVETEKLEEEKADKLKLFAEDFYGLPEAERAKNALSFWEGRKSIRIQQTEKKVSQNYRKMKVGFMIETLEAVKNIKDLVSQSDFVSVGTNDLMLSIVRHRHPGEKVYRTDERHSKEFKDLAPELLEALWAIAKEVRTQNHGKSTDKKKVCAVCGEWGSTARMAAFLARLEEETGVRFYPVSSVKMSPRQKEFLRHMPPRDVKKTFKPIFEKLKAGQLLAVEDLRGLQALDKEIEKKIEASADFRRFKANHPRSALTLDPLPGGSRKKKEAHFLVDVIAVSPLLMAQGRTGEADREDLITGVDLDHDSESYQSVIQGELRNGKKTIRFEIHKSPEQGHETTIDSLDARGSIPGYTSEVIRVLLRWLKHKGFLKVSVSRQIFNEHPALFERLLGSQRPQVFGDRVVIGLSSLSGLEKPFEVAWVKDTAPETDLSRLPGIYAKKITGAKKIVAQKFGESRELDTFLERMGAQLRGGHLDVSTVTPERFAKEAETVFTIYQKYLRGVEESGDSSLVRADYFSPEFSPIHGGKVRAADYTELFVVCQDRRNLFGDVGTLLGKSGINIGNSYSAEFPYPSALVKKFPHLQSEKLTFIFFKIMKDNHRLEGSDLRDVVQKIEALTPQEIHNGSSQAGSTGGNGSFSGARLSTESNQINVTYATLGDLKAILEIQKNSPAEETIYLSEDQMRPLIENQQVLIAEITDKDGKKEKAGAIFMHSSLDPPKYATALDPKQHSKEPSLNEDLYCFWIIADQKFKKIKDQYGKSVSKTLLDAAADEAKRLGKRAVVAYSRAGGVWEDAYKEFKRDNEPKENFYARIDTNKPLKAAILLHYLFKMAPPKTPENPEPKASLDYFINWLEKTYPNALYQHERDQMQWWAIINPGSLNGEASSPTLADDIEFVSRLGILLRKFLDDPANKGTLPVDPTIGGLHSRNGAFLRRVRLDSRPGDWSAFGSNVEMSYGQSSSMVLDGEKPLERARAFQREWADLASGSPTSPGLQWNISVDTFQGGIFSKAPVIRALISTDGRGRGIELEAGVNHSAPWLIDVRSLNFLNEKARREDGAEFLRIFLLWLKRRGFTEVDLPITKTSPETFFGLTLGFFGKKGLPAYAAYNASTAAPSRWSFKSPNDRIRVYLNRLELERPGARLALNEKQGLLREGLKKNGRNRILGRLDGKIVSGIEIKADIQKDPATADFERIVVIEVAFEKQESRVVIFDQNGGIQIKNGKRSGGRSLQFGQFSTDKELDAIIRLVWNDTDSRHKLKKVFKDELEGKPQQWAKEVGKPGETAAQQLRAYFVRIENAIRQGEEKGMGRAARLSVSTELRNFFIGVAQAATTPTLINGSRLAVNLEESSPTTFQLIVDKNTLIAKAKVAGDKPLVLRLDISKQALAAARPSSKNKNFGLSIQDIRTMHDAVDRRVAELLGSVEISNNTKLVMEIDPSFLPADSFDFYAKYLSWVLQDLRQQPYGQNVLFQVVGPMADKLSGLNADTESLFVSRPPADFLSARKIRLALPQSLAANQVNLPMNSLSEGDVPPFGAIARLAVYLGKMDLSRIPQPVEDAYATLAGERPDSGELALILTAQAKLETLIRYSLKPLVKVSINQAIQFFRLVERMVAQAA